VSAPTVAAHAPAFFRADLQRLNSLLQTAGAVLPPDPTDGFQGLDPTILPAVQDTYARLQSYGWAQGWLVP
jgi:hypothetical protein